MPRETPASGRRDGSWLLVLFASAGLLSAALASAIIWWVVTDPVSVGSTASAVASGNDGVMDIASAIGVVVLDAVRALLRLL
jgi:hypothetical protein